MKTKILIVVCWILCWVSTFYAGKLYATPDPAVDRDAWLILQCDEPILVMFITNSGKLEAHKILKPEDLKQYQVRAKAAPNKYAVHANKNCGYKVEGL